MCHPAITLPTSWCGTVDTAITSYIKYTSACRSTVTRSLRELVTNLVLPYCRSSSNVVNSYKININYFINVSHGIWNIFCHINRIHRLPVMPMRHKWVCLLSEPMRRMTHTSLNTMFATATRTNDDSLHSIKTANWSTGVISIHKGLIREAWWNKSDLVSEYYASLYCQMHDITQ